MSAERDTGWHARNSINKQVEKPASKNESVFEKNRRELAETVQISRETRKATERILKD
jgi:hypothetical protein